MIDITLYHWVWYLLGFLFVPRLTIMICLSIYFKDSLPLPLFVIGWVLAILGSFTPNYRG